MKTNQRPRKLYNMSEVSKPGPRNLVPVTWSP